MSARGVRLTAEQRLAVAARAPILLVSASAGTGKTKTLVEKVLGVLHEDLTLRDLLVITFTQKAAEELQERLFDALSRDDRLRPQRLLLAQSDISTIDSFCARLLRTHAVAAGIDPAFRVLPELEAQLMLEEILDDLFHHWYLGRAKDEADEGAWAGVPVRDSSGHREFLRLVDLCGQRGGRELLKDEIARMLQLARVHPDPEAHLLALEESLAADPPVFLAPLAALLREAWQAGLAAYQAMLATAARDCPQARLDAHRRFHDALLGAPWPDAPPELFTTGWARLRRHLVESGCSAGEEPWNLRFPRLPVGSGPWLRPYNELAKEILGAASSSRSSSPFHWIPSDAGEVARRHLKTVPMLETMLALVTASIARYTRRKREEGSLDFADLELEARRLLTTTDALAGRYKLVFVDEFQDVNRLQADIVERLRPVEGRFLVGDVKQCIYQFRLAEPGIFRAFHAGALVARPQGPADDAADWRARCAGAERVRLFLSRNFRSRYPVLAFANSLFAGLLPAGMLGGDYAEEALAFGCDGGLGEEGAGLIDTVPTLERPAPRPALSGARGWAPVELHLIEETARGEPEIGAALAAEAALIGRHARELVAAGFPIWDADEKRWRPAGYGDIAVLLRSPGPVGGPLARLLREQGLPVAFGVQGFFAREEVRDCLNLLRVLDNAADDVALAGLLRAPASPFTDADLVRLRLAWPQAGSLSAALRAAAAGAAVPASGPPGSAGLAADERRAWSGKCARFVADLDRWRARVGHEDLPAALAAIFEESGLRAAVAGAGSAVERLGNLERMLALARDFCRDRDHALAGFVRTCNALEASGSGPEPVVAPEGGEALRIFSLHKAKGLEFPIVYLAQLGRRFNTRDLGKSVLTGEDWLGIDALDPQEYVKTPSIARRVLAVQRRRRLIEEELRILYVGVTRAQEKLVLVGSLPRGWSRAVAEARPWSSTPAVREALLYRAGMPLDWLIGRLGALGCLPGAAAQTAAREDGGARPAEDEAIESRPNPFLTVERHARERLLAEWKASPATRTQDARGDRPPAAAPPRPAGGAPPASPGGTTSLGSDPNAFGPECRQMFARIARPYPHAAASRWRGKYRATEVKNLIDLAVADEREGELELLAPHPATEPRESIAADPRAEGIWLHAILAALDLPALSRDNLTDALLACAAPLAARLEIPAPRVTADRLAPLAAFLESPLGREMRSAAQRLERESPFALKLRPRELSAVWPDAAGLDEGEWILVQGQIDALWPRDDGSFAVVDFKSDAVASDAEIAARTDRYRPQLWFYREAALRLWRAKRVVCYLCFLRPGRAVAVD